MPMPNPGDVWPTPEWALAFEQYTINDAWASSDQRALLNIYAGAGGAGRGDDVATHYNKSDGTRRRGGLRGLIGRMFNGRIVESDEARTRLHIPVAANVATLAADVLTAEPPTFRIVNGQGETVKSPAQDQLDSIMNSPATQRVLAEGAELTASVSACVLTAHWDKDGTDKPWMQVTPCDAAIPEFEGTKLVAVNLYTTYEIGNIESGLIDAVYVHIERHEPGRIVHGLYKTPIQTTSTFGFTELGQLVPLTEIPDTERFAEIPFAVAGPLPNTIALPTGIKTLTAAWWRHKPTKQFRKYGTMRMLGRSATEGAEQLLDAIDEVWSSWMRDIKIARARLIVPESFLDLQGPGLGAAFDDDREILTALNFTDLGDNETISAQQFKIRSQEHAATLSALTQEIVRFAGYSLSSYGDDSISGRGGTTATEVVDRTTATERTRDKQFLYFQEAAEQIANAMMELAKVHYGGVDIPADAELTIEIPELSQMDPEKEARVFQYLRTAMAASTKTLVKAQHADWEQTEIDKEVLTIQAESGISGEPPADPGSIGRNPQQLDAAGNPIPQPGEPAPGQPPAATPGDPGNGNLVQPGQQKIQTPV